MIGQKNGRGKLRFHPPGRDRTQVSEETADAFVIPSARSVPRITAETMETMIIEQSSCS